jgi:6-phosphogluconolactonase (cycloisomerase 2 family)
MRIYIVIITVLLLVCCQTNKNETRQENNSYSFFVGTYTNSESQGIYKYLLVANQHTNNIVSFKRDITTGLLKYSDQIEAPTPVCILF